MPAFHDLAGAALPGLTAENYRVTSPGSWEYNCIAWAVGVTDAWWWPVPGRYWPPEVPREETIAAFLSAFALYGYTSSANAEIEAGAEKIVLYATGETPTHAARQLPGGWWTSKLGPNIDIEHATLDAIAGGVYGSVVAILRRQAAG
jgi:hypothetical protein